MVGQVPFVNTRAKRREACCDVRRDQVRPGDLIAEIDEKLGNPAHPDSADPYKMQMIFFLIHN